ncbi:MAG: TRAP transporter large permease subunit [Deltaproteobacteria bacterium]|nr:TRAP transporter large permease subunit [Deltaproteobacteria bacterium]MBW2309158.1 TRAP transporter large permease subunit [Deltaproteobacteria bacterium]
MLFTLFTILILMFLLGVPIAVSLGMSVIITFIFFSDFPLFIVAQRLYANLTHYPLMAVPFFIIAGKIMERGGIARRLIDFANTLVGQFPGGLALTGILACMFFASISGSSTATVAAIGSIMIPGMLEKGYGRNFAVGSITTAGALGILIPPSIAMIIYGFVTETSVGKLFIAGIIPGIFLGFSLMVVSFVVAKKRGFKSERRFTWLEKTRAFKNAIWSLLLPVIVVVGIYGVPAMTIGSWHIKGGGIFTPTEAAAVCVIYAVIVSVFIYKEIKLRDLPGVILQSANIIAMLMFIITTAMLFGFILTNAQVPHHVAQWVIEHNFSPWLFLLMVNIILFFAGDFMDPTPIIMIFIPVLFPAVEALGIDPIHFGIIVVVNMEMGLVTPPIGMNLYVASAIMNMPLYDVLRASLPWILVIVFVLIVITYVPVISTFLPKLMYGRYY